MNKNLCDCGFPQDPDNIHKHNYEWNIGDQIIKQNEKNLVGTIYEIDKEGRIWARFADGSVQYSYTWKNYRKTGENKILKENILTELIYKNLIPLSPGKTITEHNMKYKILHIKSNIIAKEILTHLHKIQEE